ncbi:MAG: TRASH domain-containing protein [Candidatus Hodarchaeota archaeon]
MTTHKCYNCGKEINIEPDTLQVKLRNKTYFVCSDRCKLSVDNFLSLLITEG